MGCWVKTCGFTLLTAFFSLCPAAPAAESVSFTQTLYPVLEKAGCRACHNVDGVASATRLHFPEADATPDQIEAFGKSLVILVDRAHPEDSLLFKKPTARISHTGGQKIKPGSPGRSGAERLGGYPGPSFQR